MLTLTGLQSAHFGPVSLTVPMGECVAIVGPSGGGKSLLLRAVVDLDLNDGEALLDGTSRAAMPAPAWRRRVALVPAESGWWADDVAEHFPDDAAVEALLAALGLPREALHWTVARLSSGERHRLAIARALCLAPRVLLLDEPTASLDAEATAQVEALLKQRMADGLAILLVTHDRAQPDRLGAARTLTLKQGRFVEPAEAGA
jgi:ABC-type iron transport system FetAB ATPase subunit